MNRNLKLQIDTSLLPIHRFAETERENGRATLSILIFPDLPYLFQIKD